MGHQINGKPLMTTVFGANGRVLHLIMKPYRFLPRCSRWTKAAWSDGLALALCAGGFSAGAQVRPTHRPAIPNFDKRAAVPLKQAAAVDQQRGVDRLAVQLPSVSVDFDRLLQTPHFIRARGGFLTGQNGAGRGMPLTQAAPANDPHGVIKAFLNEHATLFGHDASVLQDARVKRDYVDAHNGLRTVIWEQQLDSIPVFRSTLRGHVTKRGELTSISSLFVPDAAASADAGTPDRATLQAKLPISAIEAIVLGARNIDRELAPAQVLEGKQRPNDGGYQLFNTPEPAFARLVWLPLNRSSLRLAWEVMVSNQKSKE
ncbi:MAG: hypothetical protein EHM35_19025, partial [Planctomycetaceae bacterium]